MRGEYIEGGCRLRVTGPAARRGHSATHSGKRGSSPMRPPVATAIRPNNLTALLQAMKCNGPSNNIEGRGDASLVCATCVTSSEFTSPIQVCHDRAAQHCL